MTAEAPNPPRKIINSLGMTLVLIPKGVFTMGSPHGETGREPNEVEHQVTISKAFYISTKPVTNRQFWQIMSYLLYDELACVPEEERPRGERLVQWRINSSPEHPTETAWTTAVDFCRNLTGLERTTGRAYRLPTEAEWEYACRAGTNTAFCFGNDEAELGNYGWYEDNSNEQIKPVGQKLPNAWGLYDMHGNVWEWCSDWYSELDATPVADPKGPLEGEYKVGRGGNVSWEAKYCRSAYRSSTYPTDDSGFRVVMFLNEHDPNSLGSKVNEQKLLTETIALDYYWNFVEDLRSFEAIEDKAAQILSTVDGDLDLSGLRSLSDAAAESLSNHSGLLNLNGLLSLSDAAAQSLSSYLGFLDLSGLTNLSDEAACNLGSFLGEGIDLSGLTHLSNKAAEGFSNFESVLYLLGLDSLSEKAAYSLSLMRGELHLPAWDLPDEPL